MSSLGTLVDRLTILNIKLWFVQNKVNQAARENRGVDAETTGQLVALNLERNRVMTEIDQVLDAAARSGKAIVDARVKLP